MAAKDKIDEIINSVRGVLDNEGLYTPILDRSIEDLAQISYMKRIMTPDQW